MPHDKENPLHFGADCDEFPMADRRVPRFQTESIPEAEWNRRLERIAKEETSGDYPVEHYENVKDMADIVARQNARQADAKAGDRFIITEVGSMPWAMAMLEAGHIIRNVVWDGQNAKTLWYCDTFNQSLQWWNPDLGHGPFDDKQFRSLSIIRAGYEIVTLPEAFEDAIKFGPPEIHIAGKTGGSHCVLLRRGDFNNNPLNQTFEFDGNTAILTWPEADE